MSFILLDLSLKFHSYDRRHLHRLSPSYPRNLFIPLTSVIHLNSVPQFYDSSLIPYLLVNKLLIIHGPRMSVREQILLYI